MKNTNQTMLCRRNHNSRRGEAFSASAVHNLRPARHTGDATVLQVAGAPLMLAGTAGWTPVCRDGNILIVKRGHDVGLTAADGSQAQVTVLASLGSDVLTAAVITGRLYVTTCRGIVTFVRGHDGGWRNIGPCPAVPSVTVMAQPSTFVQTTLAGLTTTTVGAACRRAYCDLDAAARTGGAMLQPVLAAVRLLDADGNALFTTDPVLVTTVSGPQLATPWIFNSPSTDADEQVILDDRQVSAQPYTLAVAFDDSSLPQGWKELVATAKVLVSPQFHPDTEGECRVDVGRQDSGARQVRVTMPGSQYALSPTRPEASRQVLAAVADRFDDLATLAAVIHNPFADCAVTHTVDYVDNSTPAESYARIRAALRKSCRRLSPVASVLSRPGTMTAGHVAVSAANVAWGDVRLVHAPAPSPAVWSCSLGDRRWEATVRVDFSNGDCVVTHHSGGRNPLAFSPYVSYPEYGAVRLTVLLSVDGVANSIVFPLQPDGTGRSSVWMSDTPLPVTVDAEPVVIDDGDSLNEPRPLAAVVVSAATCPLTVTGHCRLPDTVTALMPARSSGSAWEFGRSRFWLFTDRAITMLNVSAAGQLSVTDSDSRHVRGRQCVADAGNCLYALADGVVLKLDGWRPQVVATAVAGDALGYIEADNELVTGHADDNVLTHYCLDHDWASYTTDLTLADSTSWLATDGTAYAVTAGGIVSLADTAPLTQTPVRWTAVMTRGERRQLTALLWNVKGAAVKGTLDVRRRWLTDLQPVPATVGRLAVNGCLRAPLRMPLFGHPARDLTVDLQAVVSPDFALSQPAQLD